MIKLSYCTFGLTNLDFLTAIDVISKAGYEGVEISFHRDQLNPFELTDERISSIKQKLDSTGLVPACVATASHFFFPARPHEPSLMCSDLAGRKRRIDLVKRGIRIARKLEVPVVTFGSGFIRDEHVRDTSIDPEKLLIDSINQCLEEISTTDQMTLLIEPEPGMYIETVDQGMALVDKINSPNFRLHLDLCHLYCTETDYLSALAKAAAYTRYLHVSDASSGYNLKIIPAASMRMVDLDFAHYLVYFPENAAFLLLDRKNPIYFHDPPITEKQKTQVAELVVGEGIEKPVMFVEYPSLYAGSTPFDDESFTYLISVPGLSFDVLERAQPILSFLRGTKNQAGNNWIDKRIANTLTGVVHYHEIPGEGSLDFGACFRTLEDHGFSGYASVELYHHVTLWEEALNNSYRHLSQYTYPRLEKVESP